MAKFKTAVAKVITCPRCGEKYEAFLGAGKSSRSGLGICSGSTNKAFADKNGFIWCGAHIAFEIGRGYTMVGIVTLHDQPSRFRRLSDEQPNGPSNRPAAPQED